MVWWWYNPCQWRYTDRMIVAMAQYGEQTPRALMGKDCCEEIPGYGGPTDGSFSSWWDFTSGCCWCRHSLAKTNIRMGHNQPSKTGMNISTATVVRSVMECLQNWSVEGLFVTINIALAVGAPFMISDYQCDLSSGWNYQWSQILAQDSGLTGNHPVLRDTFLIRQTKKLI